MIPAGMRAADPTPSVLDRRLLSTAEQLALTARRLVAGALAGVHPSLRPGQGREFSQYRAYQPGDEPRDIDWKLYARSDRYFLREGERDARVALTLVLDATGSMQHRGMYESDPRKFDGARSLAAALALLAERQGDRLALHVVSNESVSSLSTVGRREPFRTAVNHLIGLKPHGRWPTDTGRLARVLRQIERDGASTGTGASTRISVILTDGHEHDGEIRAALMPFRTRCHELLFLNFVARDEREFPFRGPVRFEEWETGRTVEANATAVRERYLASVQESRRAWSRFWGDDRFDYLELMTDEPLDRGLRAFLRRRLRH